jgi:Tfp pilus assembly protein PilE
MRKLVHAQDGFTLLEGVTVTVGLGILAALVYFLAAG